MYNNNSSNNSSHQHNGAQQLSLNVVGSREQIQNQVQTQNSNPTICSSTTASTQQMMSSQHSSQHLQQYYAAATANPQQNQYYNAAASNQQTTNLLTTPYASYNNQTVNVNQNTSAYVQQQPTTSIDSNSTNYINHSQQQQMPFSTTRYNAFAHAAGGGAGGAVNQHGQNSIYNAYNASTPAGGGGGVSKNLYEQASAYSGTLSAQSSSLQQQQQQSQQYATYPSSYSSLSQLNPSAVAYHANANTHLDTFGVDTTSLHRGMLSTFRSSTSEHYSSASNTSIQQQLQHNRAFGGHIGLAAAAANNTQQQGDGDRSGILSNAYVLTPSMNTINYANMIGGGAHHHHNSATGRPGVNNGVDYQSGSGVVVSVIKKDGGAVTLGDKMILEKIEKIENDVIAKLKKLTPIQGATGTLATTTANAGSSMSTSSTLTTAAAIAMFKAEELKKLAGVGGGVTIATEGLISTKKSLEGTNQTPDTKNNEKVKEIDEEYDFPLAAAAPFAQRKCVLKVLAGHGVVGCFFGANGHRVQALQQAYDVTVLVTTKRVHFPGSNNKGVLLFQGKLVNILKSLRPLFRAMQEETVRLFLEDSSNIQTEKIKLEVEVIVPESLRFQMDRQREFRQLMDMTGSNIRVIKQTYEDSYIQERVLVIFGRWREVEMAIERISILIQEDVSLKAYQYMKYPDLTVAFAVAPHNGIGNNDTFAVRNNASIGGNRGMMIDRWAVEPNTGDSRIYLVDRKGDRWHDRGGIGGGGGGGPVDRGADRGERLDKNERLEKNDKNERNAANGPVTNTNTTNETRDDEKSTKRRGAAADIEKTDRKSINENKYERKIGANERKREDRMNNANRR